MKLLTSILLILPLPLLAQTSLELSHEELNPETQDVLIKRREKFLQNESMIYDLNGEYGVRDQRRYTGADGNRLSLSGHVNGSYERLTNILGFELAYLRRSTRYHQAWMGAQLFAHSTFFDTVSMNPSTGSDAQFPRPDNVKNQVLGLGPGVGYRFKFLLDLFDAEDVFETVDVFVNYLQLNESFVRRKYRGYGLSANYGIHKRSSTNFFWGGKFAYNIGVVTRNAIADEPRSERSLSLGWLSYAFEIGFYY